jgi:MFS family permease
MSPSRIRLLVLLAFFLEPIAFGSWLPRIPDVQDALGLGAGGLALALLGLPIGTLLALPITGPLVGRIGAKRGMVLGFVFYSLAICLPALAPSGPWLFVALVVTGATNSFMALGLNIGADWAEKHTGRLLMNTAHGAWALGIMAGSLLGSAMAGLHIAPGPAIAFAAALVLGAGVLTSRALPSIPAEVSATAGTDGKPRFRLPTALLLAICLTTFGMTLTEGAMADWSAIFMRDVLGAEGGASGLGYSVFAGALAGGRFGGDWLKHRLGAAFLARCCAGLALAGVTTLLIAPSIPFALLGFSIAGVGASVAYPLAVSAAASLPTGTAATNVATLSFVSLFGFLLGPPVIGFIAEHLDVRAGLAALLPPLLLSLALAGSLRPRPEVSPLPVPSGA